MQMKVVNNQVADSRLRAVLAVLPPVAAFLLQWLYWPYMQPYVWFLFYPAVFFSAWIGGPRAGMAATLLSAVTVWWFFIEPRYSFAITQPRMLISILMFTAMGVLFSLLHGRLRNALAQSQAALAYADDLNKQLELRVQQRTEQLAQTHQIVQNSEVRLASVIESAMDAIISIDSERRIVLFNAAAEAVFGCKAAAALGQSIDTFIPERFRPIYSQRIDAVGITTATSRSQQSLVELFGVRSDGNEFPIEASISHADLGGQQLLTMILRDITQRRQIEQSLRDSEVRFHRLFDGMLEGCQIIGFDWRYLYINESAARNSRTVVADRLGKTLMEVFPGVEKTQRFADFERCMRERTSQRHESRVDYPDGSFAWFEVTIQPAPEGIFILAIDITERKEAAASLRRSDERLRQIADSLPQLIWTARPGGVCEFASRQWQEYTGLPAESQLGLGWFERVHTDDRSRLMDEWLSAANQSEFRTEARLQRHDGVYRWFDIRATPLRGAQGQVVEWVCSNTDITDRRRAGELQLRSQKMEALGTLAGGIAHDFNNILLAIKGNTRLAIDDLGPGHPVQDSLGEIDRASTRASELVRRILSFSRQEEPKREVMQLRPIVEEALKLLRSTLPAIIELRSRYAESVPATIADSSQVHQVIMNLATNASHAIGMRAGTIEMVLEAVNVDAALAQATPGLREGSYVRLTVSDSGCGMDRATLQRIFDPFFTTKPVGQGTGLGLSVVDGIMKTHGGVITVYSQPGKGTAFRLYFPATQAASQGAPVPPAPVIKAQGQRVLYVDDDQALVLLAVRTLSRLGYQVTGCTHPREALDMFRANPTAYDVVVTDLSMPTMSGTELTREILAVRAEVPVIITSGYLRPEDQEVATQLGAVALILKPNSIEELGQVFHRLFGGA